MGETFYGRGGRLTATGEKDVNSVKSGDADDNDGNIVFAVVVVVVVVVIVVFIVDSPEVSWLLLAIVSTSRGKLESSQ